MKTETIKSSLSRLNYFIQELSYYTLLIILGGIIVFFIVLIKAKTAEDVITSPPLIIYTVFVTAFQMSRLVSAMFFKYSNSKILGSEEKKRAHKYEPFVSFVVPCMNEEAAIRKTITTCFESDYPKDKFEVIVINDGSTDKTGKIIKEMLPEYPNLIFVDWKVNKGKRHGMAEGFRRAKGEIIIQLDSDSYIIPETFRELIKPFMNPKIGAVCAHADPENADVNFLTKMQTAYYFMSFRILKAAESTYGLVLCCSGCSSAYRKKAVMPILDKWLNETFLGQPVTWGDDRALTSWVLKMDYKTIYTDDAKARTIVPEKFRQFVVQQVRWKKSWLINAIFTSKFIWKKEPFISLVYFFPLTLVTLLTPIMVTRALVYTPIFKNPTSVFFYATGVLLVATALIIFYRFVARDNKYWPYLIAWATLNMFFMSFLLFYSLATIQNRKWGTR